MVSDSLSSNEGGGGRNAAASLTPHTDKFMELFPYYLNMGMSYTEYWEGDARLVKAYRKANEFRLERENSKLWLQGRYVYEAFGRIAPLLHPFTKGEVKAQPYLSQPYPLTERAALKQKEEREKQEFEEMMREMDGFRTSHNEKIKGR